jgi:hypothetical protein
MTAPSAGAEIVWTCPHCGKAITLSNAATDHHNIRTNPLDRTKGYAYVAGGTYHDLVVHSRSAWTMRFERRLVLK